MSTLTSSTTLAELKAAYANNSSYEEDNSVSKAKIFITACRMLIQYPQTVTSTTQAGTEQMTYDLRLLQSQLEAARIWLANNETTSSGAKSRVKAISFENFR